MFSVPSFSSSSLTCHFLCGFLPNNRRVGFLSAEAGGRGGGRVVTERDATELDHLCLAGHGVAQLG